MAQPLDLTGQVFTRLTVLELVRVDKDYMRFWRCRCICGATVVVRGDLLRSGNTRSCNCLARDTARAGGIHHGSHTPEYRIWIGIIARCENPRHREYKNYRDRAFEPEFRQSFEAWLEHVGRRPSPKHMIERINNELGYVRGNMRWALPIEQHNNKRTNRYLTLNGRTQTTAQWARELGWPAGLIGNRLYHGWSVERTLTTPPMNCGLRHSRK